jgi:hypothetical protein
MIGQQFAWLFLISSPLDELMAHFRLSHMVAQRSAALRVALCPGHEAVISQ